MSLVSGNRNLSHPLRNVHLGGSLLLEMRQLRHDVVYVFGLAIMSKWERIRVFLDLIRP